MNSCFHQMAPAGKYATTVTSTHNLSPKVHLTPSALNAVYRCIERRVTYTIVKVINGPVLTVS